MSTAPGIQDLRPGSAEYLEHVREEIEHYGRIYENDAARETLTQPVPTAWFAIENLATERIRSLTGNTVMGHLIDRLGRRQGSRFLSLGSGPGGVEIEAVRHAPESEALCLDINTELLALGRERAAGMGLRMEFAEADLNTVRLPPGSFDLVLCHASLHHVIELEWLADQIRGALRPGGVLVTVDVVTRNGYLMWPETRDVVAAIWKTLPSRYRLNHTAYRAPLIDDEIWEADTSASGMECARSEDILPVLESRFAVDIFVPYFSISRRFFDTMYGPNYDLEASLDRALLDWIWHMDVHYLTTGRLKPETFFGIYRSKR